MKKISFLALCLTVLTVLAACGSTSESPALTSTPAATLSASTATPAATDSVPDPTPTPSSSDEWPTPAAMGEEVSIEAEEAVRTFSGSMKILEVVRGQDAWNKIVEKWDGNAEAPEGYEYVLVKISVKIDTVEDEDALQKGVYISSTDFKSFTSDNEETKAGTIITPDHLINNTLLNAGDSKEGNMVFLVKKDDPSPKMVYKMKNTGTDGFWFALS